MMIASDAQTTSSGRRRQCGHAGAGELRRRADRRADRRCRSDSSFVPATIVVDDDNAVAREADVELEPVDAEGQPLSKAASVFSGASPLPPRCAKTSGRARWKKGCLTRESVLRRPACC